MQWIPEDLSLEVKRPEHEAEYSPRFSAKVNNGGATPFSFRASSCSGTKLVKQTNNFAFTFYACSITPSSNIIKY
jgi:hypothetical protein